LHANEKAILVFDQEYQYILAETIFFWSHIMLWVAQDTRLENGC
jgi:hypothetical protein